MSPLFSISKVSPDIQLELVRDHAPDEGAALLDAEVVERALHDLRRQVGDLEVVLQVDPVGLAGLLPEGAADGDRPRSTAETPETFWKDSTPSVRIAGYSIPSMYFWPSFWRIS
jgi:hypothetical protein